LIEIKEYKFEENYQEDYLKLVSDIYSDYKGVTSYIGNLRKLLNPKNPFFDKNEIWNFIAFEDEKPIGHISAIIDKRLQNKKIGFLGFFECTENKNAFEELLRHATKKLESEGCKIIRAPINLSIWHSYRFALEQNPKNIFYFEPLSKQYYDAFFREYGFSVLEEYYSAERTNFDSIIALTKKDYENLSKEGYKIRTINLENLEHELDLIYDLSKEMFNVSENYVELNKEEFMFLYSDMKGKVFSEFIEIVSNSNEDDVGFCFSIPDPLNLGAMIMKTIAVKNAERRKGIGAALLYSQHLKAKNLGFKRFIYALIRDSNSIKKLPYPDARIISQYRTYEKIIR
jgi:N-acetylglutamate synthase-like GNAT family acetyltransferase/GNAT superfamily N-acetyltransferase